MADYPDLDVVFEPGPHARRQGRQPGKFWIIMHDVEGNEFCVIGGGANGSRFDRESGCAEQVFAAHRADELQADRNGKTR